jgi:hypothetical protein
VTRAVTDGNHIVLAHIESDKLQFEAFCRENWAAKRPRIESDPVTNWDNISNNSASRFAFGKCCGAMIVHSDRSMRDAPRDS